MRICPTCKEEMVKLIGPLRDVPEPGLTTTKWACETCMVFDVVTGGRKIEIKRTIQTKLF